MVVLSVIIFAILGELYTERGSMLSTAIFMYSATSPINGYAGGGLYARMGGRVWIKQMILSAFMLPLMVCGTAFFINFIAMYYHASRAIPFASMVRDFLDLRFPSPNVLPFRAAYPVLIVNIIASIVFYTSARLR